MKSPFFLVESHEIAIFNHHLVKLPQDRLIRWCFAAQCSRPVPGRFGGGLVTKFSILRGVHQQTWYDLMFFLIGLQTYQNGMI
jgi:hypothetical protein